MEGGAAIQHGQPDGWSRERFRQFGRRAALTGLWTTNLVLVAFTLRNFAVSGGGDWRIYVEAGRRVIDGGLYAWGPDYAWSYSPLLAFLFAAIAPIGFLGWSVLHVAALAGLASWRLAAITAASWPFWADLYNGNTVTFLFVAAAGALRGSPVATASYLGLCLLIPRPLALPILVWILWKRPTWRLRFAVMLVISGVLVLISGYGVAWFDALTAVPDVVDVISEEPSSGVTLVTWWSVWLGVVWLPFALAIAGFLTLRGRLGWASLAASPYWLPQYLLMALLEAARRDDHDADTDTRH